MNTHDCFYHSTRKSKSAIFLILSNLIGLLLGIIIAKPRDGLTTVFFAAYFTNPSIFSLFLTTGVSILIAVVILRTRLLILSYPFVFLWSVCHGFCGMLTFYAIGEGAWLVRFFFLFTSNCLSVLLWWLFLRHFKYLRQSFINDVMLVAFLSAIIFVFDIFLIPDILSSVSTYF